MRTKIIGQLQSRLEMATPQSFPKAIPNDLALRLNRYGLRQKVAENDVDKDTKGSGQLTSSLTGRSAGLLRTLSAKSTII